MASHHALDHGGQSIDGVIIAPHYRNHASTNLVNILAALSVIIECVNCGL